MTACGPMPVQAGPSGARPKNLDLLEKLRQPAIGQRLALGLTGRAVLESRVAERHLANGVAADRAGFTLAAVHSQAALLLSLQVAEGQSPRPLDRVRERPDDHVVEVGGLL